MNKRLGLGAIAIAVIAIAVWLMARPRAVEPTPVTDQDAAPQAAHEPESHAAPAAAAGNGAAPQPPATEAETETKPAAPGERPKSTIRIAFESEARDATAPAAETQLRAIYDAEPTAKGVLRGVRCTQTVCKVEARWSKELNAGYNKALLAVIHKFGKDITLEPDGPPDATSTPIAIYVRRPMEKGAAQ